MRLLGTLLGRPSGSNPASASLRPTSDLTVISQGLATSGTGDPGQWLIDLFGGVLTSAGIRISPELAMTVPGIAACVNVLSEDLAKVPLVLYRRKRGGGREQAKEHPLYTKLMSFPAPWLSAFNWRRTLTATAMVRGNGFSRVHWNGRGEVTRFQPVKPGRASVRWTTDGEPFFDHMDGDFQARLSYQDMIHFPYRATLEPAEHGGVMGVSPIMRHPEAVALAIAAERFAGAFFRNGARPSVAIEMDKRMPDDKVAARIRASIERAYSGLDNSFKVAVLEMGMKFRELSFKNTDSQLVEVRKEAGVTMTQMYGVPPHKVGILDRATFSNVEQQSIDYVTGPVSALATALESALAIACLTENEREDYVIEHDLNGLLRGDIATRWRAYALGRQWGWLNVDEVREFERMNPLEDGSGKTYMQPMNMGKLGEPANDDTNDDPSPGRAPQKVLAQ